MTFQLEQLEDICILALDDLWNPEENQAIIQEIEHLIAQGQRLFLIDLGQMQFMNSSGLAFLISILTRARSAGGELALCRISPKIEQLLLMTRLRSTFEVADSREEALNILQALMKN